MNVDWEEAGEAGGESDSLRRSGVEGPAEDLVVDMAILGLSGGEGGTGIGMGKDSAELVLLSSEEPLPRSSSIGE